MNHLIAGLGDVGRGLYEIFKEAGMDVTAIDKNSNVRGNFKIMHICFPFSNSFVEWVLDYAEEYSPKLTIVHSTVQPGTTTSLSQVIKAVHSPIRGRHPSMIRDIKTYVKYFGGEHSEEAAKIFQDIGIKTKCFPKPETTELGKLLSNIRWGLNIAFAQEQKRMCEFYNIKYEEVVNDFEHTRNDGLKQLARDNAIMPILFPGYIGGHCVLPNVEILMATYPSEFLKAITESNERYGKKL